MRTRTTLATAFILISFLEVAREGIETNAVAREGIKTNAVA